MIRVGLTGGYASGKSFVAAELERLGCHVIYADRLGHAVLEPEGEAYRPALDLFGPTILMPSGEAIDRKRLGQIVFSSPELLEKLNGLVHPAVFRMEDSLLRRIEAADPKGVAIIEAAILIETGRFRFFDRLILTVCKEETQIRRGMDRDKLSESQIRARLARQMASEEKVRFADYVVDTDQPKPETIKRVAQIYVDLQDSAGRSAP